jgi:hypothetical protein
MLFDAGSLNQFLSIGVAVPPGQTALMRITTTYTDTALCEELVSLGAKLNSCRLIFDRLDELFCEKLIKDR